MEHRNFVYSNASPPEIPPSFPNKENVFVLRDKFCSRPGPFLRLLQYGDCLYTLRLEYNIDEKDCAENRLLDKLYDALKKNEHRLMYPALHACGALFWSALLKANSQRVTSSETNDPVKLDTISDQALTSIKLQVKTVSGSLQVVEHESELASGPPLFPNPIPGFRTFLKQEVEFLERITVNVFRVCVRGKEYCLKTALYRTDVGIEKEVRKLHQLTGHKNILQLEALVVNDEHQVLGMLTLFVNGKRLDEVVECTPEQKSKWKAQFLDAIDFVHKQGFVWGDAKPDNILVDAQHDLCLIDFEGGYSDGWVPREVHDTIEGDKVAVPKILSFIDLIGSDVN